MFVYLYHRAPYIRSFGLIWYLRNKAKTGRFNEILRYSHLFWLWFMSSKKWRIKKTNLQPIIVKNRLLRFVWISGLWKLGPGSSCPWVARCFTGMHCITTPRETSHTWGLVPTRDACGPVSFFFLFWFMVQLWSRLRCFLFFRKDGTGFRRRKFPEGFHLRKLGVRVGVGSIQPIIPLLLDTFSKYQRKCTEGFGTALRQIDEECAETTTPTRLKRNKIKFQTNPNNELEKGTPRITKLQLMMPKRNWNQQSKRTLDIGASYGRTLTTACGPWLCCQRVNIDGFGVSSWNCNLSESE